MPAITNFVSAAINGLYEGTIRYRSKPEQKAHLQSMELSVVDTRSSGALSSLCGGKHLFAAAAHQGWALAKGSLTTRCVATICRARLIVRARLCGVCVVTCCYSLLRLSVLWLCYVTLQSLSIVFYSSHAASFRYQLLIQRA